MKILFISLGCDKNLVDTEKMMGLLSGSGYGFTNDENEADAVIVNTCCFISDAKQESINTLLEMAELRKEGKIKALIATGCLAQRYRDEIRKEIPEVDALVGIASTGDIEEALNEALKQNGNDYFRETGKIYRTLRSRIITTGGHFAYLKIAEGCNKNCTYCIIPKVRGRYVSVPME
jgi:ribosomal protein S12 methylthiotransferase